VSFIIFSSYFASSTFCAPRTSHSTCSIGYCGIPLVTTTFTPPISLLFRSKQNITRQKRIFTIIPLLKQLRISRSKIIIPLQNLGVLSNTDTPYCEQSCYILLLDMSAFFLHLHHIRCFDPYDIVNGSTSPFLS